MFCQSCSRSLTRLRAGLRPGTRPKRSSSQGWRNVGALDLDVLKGEASIAVSERLEVDLTFARVAEGALNGADTVGEQGGRGGWATCGRDL